MADAVLMPQAGQSMTEGKIVEWFVEEGATVKRGEPLLTIETDKANMDVECPANGVLRKIYHAADETVAVLEVVACVGKADEEIDFDAFRAEHSMAGAVATPAAATADSPAAAKLTAAKSAAAKPTAAKSTRARPPARADSNGSNASRDTGRPRTSPLARRLARMRGIDLGTLTGTGPQGRIIRRDVEAAADAPSARRAATAPSGVASLTNPGASKPYPPPSPRPPAAVPIEGMRKAISSALKRSKVEAPHFYLSMEIDVTAALELRDEHERRGLKMSVNDLIVRAVSIALADEPRVNCRVTDDRIEYPEDVNIGVAVGMDDGLVVPVVVGAQHLDLASLAGETRRIVDAAREGKLIGSGQGTFTISNLGMFGVDSFTAVINPPEGAILAVGAAVPRLVPIAGGFFPRSILKATLSADHRAIDGLLAAKFMARLRHLLESPDRL